jgi:hypothetical protein
MIIKKMIATTFKKYLNEKLKNNFKNDLKMKLEGLTNKESIIKFSKIYEEKNNKNKKHGVGHLSLKDMKYREFIDTIEMIYDYKESAYNYFNNLIKEEKIKLINEIKNILF